MLVSLFNFNLKFLFFDFKCMVMNLYLNLRNLKTIVGNYSLLNFILL